MDELKESAVWAVAGLYLTSWVLPLLDVIEGDPEMRDYAQEEGARALAALEKKAAEVKRLETQGAEFIAVSDVANAYRALPAIVDDGYPEARHNYERAVKTMLEAMKANGRV